MFEIVNEQAHGPLIKVIGVGGAGGNAVNHMIEKGVSMVEFIAVNTDAQVLARNQARNQIQIGTSGLGAGAKARSGEGGRARRARPARGSDRRIADGVHHRGMGGGTGTGAAPVIAEIARRSDPDVAVGHQAVRVGGLEAAEDRRVRASTSSRRTSTR
jgi:cell division protein FtsZ